MADGNLNISMTSDEKDLIKGQAKVMKQQDEMIEKYKKMLREAKKAAKEGGTELERFAAKTNKINRTPAQKYREEVEHLNQALKAGLINQETYNRAVARAGQAHNASFGASAVARLSSIAAVALYVKRVWDGITGSIQRANEEIAKIAERQKESAGGLGELSQLAETPEELRRMVADAKKTFAEGGAVSLDEAGKLQFALESAGISKYRKDVSQLQGSGTVRDATSLVNAAAALEAALGTKETGSFRDIVSKGFGASKISPAHMEDIVQAAAKSGSQGKALGIGDEELLASVAAISKVVGNADEAGTEVESLLKQIEKFGIAGGYLEGGKTLQEQVAAIDKLVKEGTDVREILGDRQEGIKAFRTLAGEEGTGLFNQAMKNIAEAERTDAFGVKVNLARQADPTLAAEQLRKRTAARSELSGEQKGTFKTVADALVEDLVADLREKGKGEFTIQQVRYLFERRRGHGMLGGMLGGSDEVFVREFGRFASEDTRESAKSIGVLLEESATSIRNAANQLEQAATNSGNTNAARANQAAAGGATEAR